MKKTTQTSKGLAPRGTPPPEPSKQFSLGILCKHCGQWKVFEEGILTNQAEVFQVAHKDCKPK